VRSSDAVLRSNPEGQTLSPEELYDTMALRQQVGQLLAARGAWQTWGAGVTHARLPFRLPPR